MVVTAKLEAPETRPGHHVIAVLLALCAFAMAYVLLELQEVAFSNNIADGSGHTCGTICNVRRTHRLEHFDGRDILNRHDLKKQVEDAKERLIATLKVDYGEYFDIMFVNEKDGSFIPVVPYGNQSLSLLKRKLMIKVLQTQQEVQRIEMDVNGCDCTILHDDTNKDFTRQRPVKIVNGASSHAALIESTFSKYVWVTGGHSAAAGHGNLYNESYTAFMERDLKDIFGSIGIDFEGRNYAMGGTASAAELAMCWVEIFGTDADFFSWDFGMIGTVVFCGRGMLLFQVSFFSHLNSGQIFLIITDAGHPWRLFHYAYRGLRNTKRPAFYASWLFNRMNDQFDKLTDLGFAAFLPDDGPERARRDQLPETTTLTGKEIDSLPEYVKYFKCNGALEKGDCDNERKYSAPCYNEREGKASWHPG
jgi:hypothetical protein